MRRERAAGLALSLSLLVLAGCNTPPTTTTITTTTVECVELETGSAADATADTQQCTTISEETTTSRRPRQCHGIVSCSFWVAGEAIALPFRALGAVFDIVF